MKTYKNFNEMFNANLKQDMSVFNAVRPEKRVGGYNFNIIDDISKQVIGIIEYDSNENEGKTCIEASIGDLVWYIKDNVAPPDTEDDPVLLSGMCAEFFEGFFETAVDSSIKYEIKEYADGTVWVDVDGVLPYEKARELAYDFNQWLEDAYQYW